MIDFVLENARQPTFRFQFHWLAPAGKSSDRDGLAAFNFTDQARDREAAFNPRHGFFRWAHNLRVDDRIKFRFNGFIFFITKFDDDYL